MILDTVRLIESDTVDTTQNCNNTNSKKLKLTEICDNSDH